MAGKPRRSTTGKLPRVSRNKTEKHGVAQRPAGEFPEYKIGYKRPPREYQWRPGVSGNPAGCPRARTNLWRHICRMLDLTPKQLRDLQKQAKKLKIVELVALKIASQLRAGVPEAGLPQIIKCILERDEGRPVQELRFADDAPLSNEECEEIRAAMRTLARPGPQPMESPDQ